jgi:GGDEF domain-containing protein
LLHLGARDRLTGLYNRGHFDRALQLEFERSARYQHPIARADARLLAAKRAGRARVARRRGTVRPEDHTR